MIALRARQQRAFLATLLLSAGVPLLLGGDEFGRTQRGNNNAYCQDNEITWFDWSTIDRSCCGSQRISSGCAAVTRSSAGAVSPPADAADLRWFTPSGTEMTAENWADPIARSVALFIDGSTDPDVGVDGTPMVDDDFLVLINAWWEPLTFAVPADLSARSGASCATPIYPHAMTRSAMTSSLGRGRWSSCSRRPEISPASARFVWR